MRLFNRPTSYNFLIISAFLIAACSGGSHENSGPDGGIHSDSIDGALHFTAEMREQAKTIGIPLSNPNSLFSSLDAATKAQATEELSALVESYRSAFELPDEKYLSFQKVDAAAEASVKTYFKNYFDKQREYLFANIDLQEKFGILTSEEALNRKNQAQSEWAKSDSVSIVDSNSSGTALSNENLHATAGGQGIFQLFCNQSIPTYLFVAMSTPGMPTCDGNIYPTMEFFYVYRTSNYLNFCGASVVHSEFWINTPEDFCKDCGTPEASPRPYVATSAKVARGFVTDANACWMPTPDGNFAFGSYQQMNEAHDIHVGHQATCAEPYFGLVDTVTAESSHEQDVNFCVAF